MIFGHTTLKVRMRPTEYPDELVIAAGKKISGEGRVVTAWGLKQLVGGGKNVRLLAVWEAHEREATKATRVVGELPIDIARDLDAAIENAAGQVKLLVGTMQQRALDSANHQVSQVQAKADLAAEQARHEQADAEQLVEKLEASVAKAQSRIEELEAKLTASDLSRQANEIAHSKLSGRFEALGSAKSLLDGDLSVRDEINRSLQALLEKSRQTEMDLRELLGHANGELSVLRTQVEQLLQAARPETLSTP